MKEIREKIRDCLPRLKEFFCTAMPVVSAACTGLCWLICLTAAPAQH